MARMTDERTEKREDREKKTTRSYVFILVTFENDKNKTFALPRSEPKHYFGVSVFKHSEFDSRGIYFAFMLVDSIFNVSVGYQNSN